MLGHFAPDAEFSSPLVPVITGRPNPLHGVTAIRCYWEEGLRRLPDLHFILDGVYTGRPVVEVLALGPGGKAVRGWALYGAEPDVR